MTDTELEKVRTAIVIKTYTAIIRCASHKDCRQCHVQHNCFQHDCHRYTALLCACGLLRWKTYTYTHTHTHTHTQTHTHTHTHTQARTHAHTHRNYSNMSPKEQDAEMARVRAFSRALFYNIRGDEDRCVSSLCLCV